MTIKSGMAGSIGFGQEVTYGIPVDPTVWVPLLKEGLKDERGTVKSAGIIAGRRTQDASQISEGPSAVSGDIGLELSDRSMGMLFLNMFGNVVTTGAGPYQHVFTPGELTGKSMTVQVGRPGSAAGVVDPSTYSGMKVASWSLGIKAGEIITLGLTLLGRHEIDYRVVTDGVTTNGSAAISSATGALSNSDVGKPVAGAGIPANTVIQSVQTATTATMSANATATATGVTFTFGKALVAVSYAANIAPISSMQPVALGAMLLLDGTAYRFKELTLAGDNGLDADRLFAGEQGHDEALEASLRPYTVTINTEYFDTTVYRKFKQGATGALVVNVGKGTSTVQFSTNVRYDMSERNIDGPGVIQNQTTLECVGTGTDASAITATLVNGDATP